MRIRPACWPALVLLLLAGGLPPAAALALDGVTASFALTQDWGTGCTAGVTITNTDSSRSLTDWRLSFSLAGTVTSSWEATRLDDQDGKLVFGPATWNATIAPGASVTVGLSVTPGGIAAPAALEVTGSWCTDCTTTTTTTTTTADSRITADRDGTTFTSGGNTPLQVHARVGQTRTFTFDKAVTAVTARNPDVARLSLADGALAVTGRAAGRTGLRLTFADASVLYVGLRIDTAAGALPGLPGPVAIGSVSEDTDADLSFWRGHEPGKAGTRADIRYIYINGGPISGWSSWDPDRATSYAKESLVLGLVPFFVFYNIPDGGESYYTDLAHVQDADYMTAYYANLALFLSQVTAVMQGELYGVILEPDFLGYMQQNSGLAPSAITTADGTLVDTVKRINAQVRADGGNVVFGWQLNLWASPTGTGARGVIRRTDDNDQGWTVGRQTIVSVAQAIAAYALSAGILTSGADFVSIDKYGLDAGIQSPDDPANSTWFWNSDHWNNYLLFVQTLGQATGKPMVLWQLPLGRVNATSRVSVRTGEPFPDLANTSQHYEDSCATYFLGDTVREATSLRADYFAQNKAGDTALSASGLTVTWGEHISALPAYGVIAALFGAGVGDSTHGTGQPPTDSWYWIQSVQEYYLAHPAPASGGPTLPFLPLLLGGQ
ncbi:MAG: cellulose binding domain-containing protein [Solidesulfovibrio sp. DCME]|uniref:cellulose binding domain-containing protein n=1 Tax=Solidesulfovibrio sp. DCME TaxID=3447380 RepID=UPI003D1283FB